MVLNGSVIVIRLCAFLFGCACYLPVVRVERLWLGTLGIRYIAISKGAGAFLSGCACHPSLPVVRVEGLWLGARRGAYSILRGGVG